jgi:hypothetical protein
MGKPISKPKTSSLMKTSIFFLGTLAVAARLEVAYGQGQVGFANNPSAPIIDMCTGLPATSSSISGVTVGLYYSTDLSAVPGVPGTVDSFVLAGTCPIVAAGVFNNGGVPLTIPGLSAGWQIVVQIRAWTGPFRSYEEAFNSGDLGIAAGRSNVTNPLTLTASPSPAPNLVIQGGLQGFVLYDCPEPSVIALGLVGGLGSLGLARRRHRSFHSASVGGDSIL